LEAKKGGEQKVHAKLEDSENADPPPDIEIFESRFHIHERRIRSSWQPEFVLHVGLLPEMWKPKDQKATLIGMPMKEIGSIDEEQAYLSYSASTGARTPPDHAISDKWCSDGGTREHVHGCAETQNIASVDVGPEKSLVVLLAFVFGRKCALQIVGGVQVVLSSAAIKLYVVGASLSTCGILLEAFISLDGTF
jgi:hypothetical protein